MFNHLSLSRASLLWKLATFHPISSKPLWAYDDVVSTCSLIKSLVASILQLILCLTAILFLLVAAYVVLIPILYGNFQLIHRLIYGTYSMPISFPLADVFFPNNTCYFVAYGIDVLVVALAGMKLGSDYIPRFIEARAKGDDEVTSARPSQLTVAWTAICAYVKKVCLPITITE